MRTRGRSGGAGTVLLVLVALLAAPSALARDAAGGEHSAHLTPLARVSVVGSGPIAWANVAVRSAPRRDAAVVARLTQFRPDYRPPGPSSRWTSAGTPQGSRPGTASRCRAGRTAAPVGSPRPRPTVAPVDRWLVVYRGSRKFEALRERAATTHGADCGRRARAWRHRSASSTCSRASCRASTRFLGAFAFETSGYSKLSDWPGGGVVGVHGTNTPWLIGQAVSHGCVGALRNRDALALRKLVRVGTPVKIVAG